MCLISPLNLWVNVNVMQVILANRKVNKNSDFCFHSALQKDPTICKQGLAPIFTRQNLTLVT